MYEALVLLHKLYPTCVGVYLTVTVEFDSYMALSHLRGGVPISGKKRTSTANFIPPTWGCTYSGWKKRFTCDHYPTFVGVYPFIKQKRNELRYLSHMRGGVPNIEESSKKILNFIPPKWEFFLTKCCKRLHNIDKKCTK